MYFNNLKKLRTNRELTQESVSNILECKRGTYSTWENGTIMLPLDIADKLSIFYNVSLSYLLGLTEKYEIDYIIKKINYNQLLKNILEMKNKNKNTFEEISSLLECDRSTCCRYFKGQIKIPMDRLVILSKIYDVDIDLLCGKR